MKPTWMRPAASLLPVPAEYLPLHKYLDDRFADTVVLTTAEIEDLLGSPLPEQAHLEPRWWANGDADSPPSPQARAWIRAGRTATPNLRARIVAFERTSA